MPSPEVLAVKEIAAAYERMTDQIGKVIVGQQQVVEQLLMAMFSRGHCLLVGVPGLAKTLLVSTRRADPAPVVQAHSVHARPDAVGHHRHGHSSGRSGNGPAEVHVSSRARSSPT